MIAELLKKETKALHDNVEHKYESGRIFDGSFTLAHYKKLLLGNYRLISTLEEPVFTLLSDHYAQRLELEKRKKQSVLKKDLLSLGLQIPAAKTNFDLKNMAEAMGALYVMEGSTLGGNVIAKNLSKLSDFRESRQTYFGFYGVETGPLWKKFQEVLKSDFSASSADLVKGAAKAYQLLLEE